MPRGSEYSDEKRAAALIMYLIFKASHSEVEAKTGVSKAAIRQLSSRAQKANVDKTSIEELIVFARTKPRKGRPRRDAKNTDVSVSMQSRHGEETSRTLDCDTTVTTIQAGSCEQSASAATSGTAGNQDLVEMIKSWEQRKTLAQTQTLGTLHAVNAREQA